MSKEIPSSTYYTIVVYLEKDPMVERNISNFIVHLEEHLPK